MGRSFTAQIDQIQHQQLHWVPRADDVYGGGEQGGSLIMLVYGQALLFDAVQITTTSAVDSAPIENSNPEGVPYDQVYAVYKTIAVVSTLNQSASFQLTWSVDMENWYPYGDATTIAASSGNPETVLISASSPSLYVPYVGAQVTCATAPTAGTLTATLVRLG